MRILHICQRDNPNTGGSLRVAEALVIEQRRIGLEAWILFLYGPPGGIAEALGQQIVCLELDSSREVFKGIFKLVREVRRLKPDVIHSHDGITWPRLAFMQIRIPVVMHSHLSADPFASLVSRLLIRFTTDAIVGISSHTVDSWVEAGVPSSKIHYVPNGVSFERFQVGEENEKKDLRKQLNLPIDKDLVLWIGRLHASTKGTERIARFAALMPDNTIVVVVGDGPSREEIQEQCREYIEDGRVIMVGSIGSPQVYYKAVDMFLFTSYQEPFGLVILEAVASGLPILSFPLLKDGGASELLKEVRAYNLDETSSRADVEALIGHVRSQSHSGERIRDAIRNKYSWEIQSRGVLSVYRTLIGVDVPESAGAVKLKVLVCQHGARHRYAIPQMLNKRGMLCGFYTDSSAESLIGKSVKLLGKNAPTTWGGFARWKIPDVPKRLIHSTDRSYFLELWQKFFFIHKKGAQLFLQRHKVLSSKMVKWGLQDAGLIYTMYHEDLDFVRWAKGQGALSAIDVFISPKTAQIMEKESDLFPDWGTHQDASSIVLERKLWEETVEIADLLICPSDWVANGIRDVSPAVAAKTVVVPYGCSIDYCGKVNSPVKGRVLFAGNDPLRKGLHYLAEAATALKPQLPELDVRVAGNLPDEVVSHPVCEDLNFLGQLSSDQMKEEYLSADALVLPALSEGFAGVVAEAIGAGCPVIVTHEAGSPVEHEREGLIVPFRNVEALSAAIRRMVMDREFRSHCAENCLKQVPFYSEIEWGERLVVALEDFVNSGNGNILS